MRNKVFGKLGKVFKKTAQGTKTDVQSLLSISAIFGFTFSNQVLTPDIYGAHWVFPPRLRIEERAWVRG